MSGGQTPPLVAVACGGTGGHLFPGLAVAAELKRLGGDALLLISPKEVDQEAVKSAPDMPVAVLPAVGMSRGRLLAFATGLWKSYRAAQKLFQERPPAAVLAMGGFTGAPPVMAGRSLGAATFLHESNTIPGRANRWLARVVDQAFVGFPSAAARLAHGEVVHTGTPVRPQFRSLDRAACRRTLGLDPDQPTLLITGGSQGAVGVNSLALDAVGRLVASEPRLQIIHLTGTPDFERVRGAYRNLQARVVVRSFLSGMEHALGAATAAISRAGASSLAELAAMRVPSVLIPYPSAADQHQFHNAKAFADSGAALMLDQRGGDGPTLATMIRSLLTDSDRRAAMSAALEKWHSPEAAKRIAARIVARLQPAGGIACP